MKFRISALLIILLAANTQSRAQYKDLEGVFFGKVAAIGVGASYISYKDKLLGSSMSFTPLNYSVLMNNKTILSMKLSLHKEVDAVYNGNDGFVNYTKSITTKFFEYELGLKIALTSEGLEKPTSVFLSLVGGNLIGKKKVTDSRYGFYDDDLPSSTFVGAGLSVFQSVGERFVLFAEPALRFDILSKTSRIYLDDNGDKKLGFNHLNVHAGIMFLIGRKG